MLRSIPLCISLSLFANPKQSLYLLYKDKMYPANASSYSLQISDFLWLIQISSFIPPDKAKPFFLSERYKTHDASTALPLLILQTNTAFAAGFGLVFRALSFGGKGWKQNTSALEISFSLFCAWFWVEKPIRLEKLRQRNMLQDFAPYCEIDYSILSGPSP